MNSEQLKKSRLPAGSRPPAGHALEVIGAVWLVVVAVQYLGRYFIGIDTDFKFVYVGALVITVLAAILKRSNGVVE